MLNAGTLNRKITLQHTPVITKNADGSSSITYTDKSIWAAINPVLTEQEFFAANQLKDAGIQVVKIRYSSLVDVKCRIKLGTRVFEILGVSNTKEANIELILQCKEI